MRRAVAQIMTLGLVRDPGALASVFIMPGLVFVIFAMIFASTAGGSIDVKLAIADERGTEASQRVIEALLDEPNIRRVGEAGDDAAIVRQMVRSGLADVGLVIRREGPRLDNPSLPGPAPLRIITDPARAISVSIFEGALMSAYPKALPDAPVRSVARLIGEQFVSFTQGQRAQISAGLTALRNAANDDGAEQRAGETDSDADEATNVRFTAQSEQVTIAGDPAVQASISYYAGSVSIMFLLFSSITGAMTLLEERENGLMDRLAIGPGGPGVLVDGKFFYLVALGCLQISVIYLVAWVGFGVNLPDHVGPWFVTTVLAACAAAGIALTFVLLCSTRQQAQQLANILVLVTSAVGGSMVPRYLMPEWIQGLGWLTPNTWVVEAYSGIFWRGESWSDLQLPWLVLAGIGLMGLLIARTLARRSL